MQRMLLVALAASGCALTAPAPQAPPPPPSMAGAMIDRGPAIGFAAGPNGPAPRTLELGSRGDGRVVRVRVAPGQHVHAGDVLIELGASDLGDQLATARTQLKTLEDQVATTAQQLSAMETYLEQRQTKPVVHGPTKEEASELLFAEARQKVAHDDRARMAKLRELGEVNQNELDAAIAAESNAERAVAAFATRHDHDGDAVDAQRKYMVDYVRVARTALELATQRRDVARESVADLERALDATRVYAMFAGVVDALLVAPGDDVTRDQPMVRITTWDHAVGN